MVTDYDTSHELRAAEIRNLQNTVRGSGPWIPGSTMKKLTFHEWNQILVSYRFESVRLFSDNLELRVALYSEFFILEGVSVFKMSIESRVPPRGATYHLFVDIIFQFIHFFIEIFFLFFNCVFNL